MVWLNVDKPTKRCVIHSDNQCKYIDKMIETSYKGINNMKRDGGWLSFPEINDAENHCNNKYEGYVIRICC